MMKDPRQFARAFGFSNVADAKLRARVLAVINLIETAPNLVEVPNLKKLRDDSFRVRVGEYRLGSS